MSDKKCCVPGCVGGVESPKNLHKFPNPAHEKDRFNSWVYAISGDILRLPNEIVYKYRRVCHAHFASNFVYPHTNRLSKAALPTLNMPDHLSIKKQTLMERPLMCLPSTSTTKNPLTTQKLILAEGPLMEIQNITVPCLPTSTTKNQFNVCRCCLSKDISEAVSYDVGKRKAHEKMLEDVFNIQILQETQSIYQYICNKCISRLLDANSFKEMVINNAETYLEYLRSIHEKGTIDPDNNLELEEIKVEVPAEVMDFNATDNTYDDDDEILANLKYEPDKLAAIKKWPETDLKLKKARKKSLENYTETQTQDTKTSKIEHRGKGPILRENSLKLLTHSTAVVFQWNKSRYRCFCCNEPFSDIELLRTHTNSHTLDEIQKKIIHQQNRLVKVDISSLNCKLCDKELRDLNDLKVHLLDHNIVVDEHLLVPFKIKSKLICQICSEPFTLFRLLNIHMNKHYQKHLCYVCGAGFSNSVFLNLHRTRSHRPIHCQKCDINFDNRTEKKKHDTKIHGLKIERRNRFPCSYCSERFFQENLRVIHLVKKHGLKKPEFNCQFCSKSFITKSLVNNHVKVVHLKEKNHECDLCHNLFYTKSDVARHRVTHTGEKNYACTLCSNPFASKDSLRRHIKRNHALQ